MNEAYEHAEALHLGDKVAEQIRHVETRSSQGGRYGAPRAPLNPLLAQRLIDLGYDKLYEHQCEAFDAAGRGEDVMICTATSSGKTLGFNLAVLNGLLDEPAARALYLYPTKALAQDQLGKLQQLAEGLPVRSAIYDGDTPQNQRGAIRRAANVVLTNPDMLHIGILPRHENWSRFFRALRYIVVDEVHAYRGVFGSHVAGVLRRLLRICRAYNSRPQILSATATIANPGEHFFALTSRHSTLVQSDGAPQGNKTFVFWSPPTVGEMGKFSPNRTAAQMLVSLAAQGKRSLAFSRARISAELVLLYAREMGERSGFDPSLFESYRGGYTAKERRTIEQRLFSGSLLGLSATNALELGVDVGSLDAVILNGFPGTVAGFWQQSGRAGRSDTDGLAIYVAHDDPLEQFFARAPRTLLGRSVERVSANPCNAHILPSHLLCAAYERPLSPSELDAFGPTALSIAEQLDMAGELSFRGGAFYYPSFDCPAMNVNIRQSTADTVVLTSGGDELGSMERWRALGAAFPGAIYLHRGRSFKVLDLDLENGVARLEPFDGGYYTIPIVESVLQPTAELDSTALETGLATLVGLHVTELVVGFKRIALDGGAIISVEQLSMKPVEYDTVGVRFSLPACQNAEDEAGYVAGVHGIEHALNAVAPWRAGCDPSDLGAGWYAAFADNALPAVFVYDRVTGGVGLAECLYADLVGWTQSALELLASCECELGCPACLLSPRCYCGNEPLDKSWARTLLRKLRPV